MTFSKKTFKSIIEQLYSQLWERVNHINPLLDCEKNNVKFNGSFYNGRSLFKLIR